MDTDAKKISLSVIVPVYNEEKTVTEILQRLLKQRAVQEIIVINDGSTDNTERRITSIKHKKIRSFKKSNGDKGKDDAEEGEVVKE